MVETVHSLERKSVDGWWTAEIDRSARSFAVLHLWKSWGWRRITGWKRKSWLSP